MISYDIYLFNYYSLSALLNRLNDLGVGVKKYYVFGEYKFYLKINRKYRRIIKDNFKDYVIEEKLGIINFFEKLIYKPITIVSLTLAICLFLNLSNRVYKIELRGDYPAIEKELIKFIKDNGLGYFSYISNGNRVKEIELKIKEEYNDSLEFVEVTREGAIITLNYKKRRKALVIEGKNGSLYAKKDGVIRGFNVLSGVKNVKVYDFVRAGDLLISDILITTNNENIIIGTLGSVYASTFYYIEVSCNLDLDDASKYAFLLDKARNEIGKNINSDEEYIEKESILNIDLNRGYMKVYYILYEDITI